MTRSVLCAGCGAPLARPAATIALLVMGDEHIESYWFCAACDACTVRVACDHFHGEYEVWTRGPFERARGEDAVRRIAACPDPLEKYCKCPTHRDWLWH